jgi:TrmH family RNA methyltransferase
LISSVSNAQIKNIMQLKTKPKARNEQNCYIVEGTKMFRELPPDDIIKVYVSSEFIKDKNNLKLLTGFSFEEVSDHVFKALSDTVTPQGILAVARQKHYTLKNLLNQKKGKDSLFLILESIRDPGNLGTIIRTGEGAGIAGIILNNESVDIYNPKVIRSTMGSIYRVPFVYVDDLKSSIEIMKKNNITIYAAHLEGESLFKLVNSAHDSAIIIGNESNGVSENIKNISDKLLKIPMCGQVESLNAAVSAAVIMYTFLHKC